MNDATELIRAIGYFLGAIAWPAVALVFLICFRSQIRLVFSRLQKVRLLNNEVVLSEEIDRVKEVVDAQGEIITPPSFEVRKQAPEHTNDTRDTEQKDRVGAFATLRAEQDAAIDRILSEAAASPKVGLISVSVAIEREMRLLVNPYYLMGQQIISHYPSVPVGFNQLVQQGYLAPSLASSAKLFWELRTKLVHGEDIDDDEVLKAVDIGITLLRTLNAVPRETNIVYHPGVAVYSDPQAEQQREGVLGLILESTSAGGLEVSRRIFPVKRIDYQKGKQVTWEWDPNPANAINESWYRDPDSGEIKYAWTSAAIFAGRHLDDN